MYPRLEPIGFALLVLLHLVPIWLFTYIPTQDGPSHLANAVIIKDYGAADARYQEFFELRQGAIPNWTSHALLVILMYVLPPLAAEKLLVSIYVVGFAWSFRYFLSGLDKDGLALAPVSLLFLFNGSFLMGFYNYLLSLILFWIVLGYCIRQAHTFGLLSAAAVAVLLLFAYFTHLAGCLLAMASACWLVGFARPLLAGKLLCVGAAVLPSSLLTGYYLAKAGFFSSLAGIRWPWTSTQGGLDFIWIELKDFNRGLFEPYEGRFPLGIVVFLLLEALLIAPWFTRGPARQPNQTRKGQLSIAFLGLAVAALYLLLPDSLGPEQGGYLKIRLAFLPPLLWLACFRLPAISLVRRCFQVVIVLLVGLNLTLATWYFKTANDELDEYTAGLDRIGRGRTLRAVQSGRPPRLSDPLYHAADYYCLTTGNVNLDNYEASLNHFPVKFRPGKGAQITGFVDPIGLQDADLILLWDDADPFPGREDLLYHEIYHQGRLRILEKTKPGP